MNHTHAQSALCAVVEHFVNISVDAKLKVYMYMLSFVVNHFSKTDQGFVHKGRVVQSSAPQIIDFCLQPPGLLIDF